jgi:predicted MPP superfamily phosphohydrolase
VSNSHQLRIAHLSDLHAQAPESPDHFGQQRVAECLIDDLAAQSDEKTVDLIIFSGDLAFDGSSDALSRGKEILLDPLRERFASVPIILTPGNHDVDRDLVDEADELGLQAVLTDRERVQARLADTTKASEARIRLRAWDQLAAGWSTGLDAEHLPPYGSGFRFECRGLDVAIASFDTAWRAQGRQADKGRLLLVVDSVQTFLKTSNDADLRIVTFHHPLAWLADFDGEPAGNALEHHQAIVLTGHDHNADPKLELTTRGAALYCAAPCTFDTIGYPNGYALIDVDAAKPATTIHLRRWQPRRDRFGRDVETAGDEGQVTFAWPIPADEAPDVLDVPHATALEPLAVIAQEQSVLADHVDDTASHTVSDFIVSPRLWPVPHTEVFDRTVEKDERAEEADPFEVLDRERVVIVAGDRSAGVTTTLLWLLEQHFIRRGTHFPAFIQTDPRFSLGKIQGAINVAKEQTRDEATPVIVAVDDVEPAERKALGRLIRVVDENPNVIFIFGCHGTVHESISRALSESKLQLSSETLFLGHFGRRETRALVARMVGPEGKELVQRVMDLVQRQRLPRNPLNLAALISVLIREPTLAAINESGLLQSYVNVLLDNPLGVDPEKLNMDQRRREHLLQRIARHIVERDVSRIERLAVEQLVIDYFESIAYHSGSAGQHIDSLIRRRVLVEDSMGVGFRYPALLHLFAAKEASEDSEFESMVFDDMERYGPVIKHMAGISRRNADILRRVVDGAGRARQSHADGVDVGQFDLITDEHGWSKVRDLDHARQLVDHRPEPPTEEELDEIYDEAIEEPADEVDLRPFDSHEGETPAKQLANALSLAAAVLQSSELVEDIDLRKTSLRDVIEGWSVITILMALEEDMFQELNQLLEPILPAGGDVERRQSAVEHIVRLFIVLLMSVTLNSEAGSVHHERILAALLDDDEFMGDSSNALFGSMMYASLEFPGWPERLATLIDRHGDHPMVRETVRVWSMMEYHHGNLSDGTRLELENLLVEIMTPDQGRGQAAAATRTAQMAEVRHRLQRARIRSQLGSPDVVEISEGEKSGGGEE